MQASFETETSTELVPQQAPDRTIATQNHWNGGDGVEGEVDTGDIRLPRINIPQKSGQLGEIFAPGSIVFHKEVLLSNGTEPLEVVALRIRKQYQEDLPFDPDGPTPKVWNTSKEVLDAKGHFTYGEDGYYKEIAHILTVVPCPDKAADEQRENFIYQHDGKDYALAMWTVTGSAYTSVAKTLFTDALGRLRGGLYQGKWALTTEKRSNAKNTWFTPLIRSLGKTTPEFQEFAKTLM